MSKNKDDTKTPAPQRVKAPPDESGGTVWRLTKMMVDAFKSKDAKYAAVLEKKDEDMAEANRLAMEGQARTIRMLWISLMLCIVLLGVVAGAIGTGTLTIGGIGTIGLGDATGEVREVGAGSATPTEP